MSERYVTSIDLDAIEALDMHVHVELGDDGVPSLPNDLVEAASAYFRAPLERPTVDQIAAYYRERRMAAVVFTVDARTSLGHQPNSVEQIVEGAIRNSDVLIPFGSVDPTTGAAAVERARKLAEEWGVRGFKFHPTVQAFDPSEDRFWPLWAELEKLGLPTIFHTGQTGIGAGLPGGRGLRLAFSNPMLLDAVAAAFPQLPIVMAHPSVPWQDEAIAVATHKANVMIDLSGWSPKYFPAELTRQANSLLQDKVLFGSDYPLLSPDRWLADFAALELKESVRPKILKDNAVRLLALAKTPTPRS